MARPLPNVPVETQQFVLAGGIDLISPPGMARPGTCRFAVNYEEEFGGGYSRVGGFERIDGRPAPSKADYVVLESSSGFNITVGATVKGSVSNAEGKVIWVQGDSKRIALTRLLPGFTFQDNESILLTNTPRGTITDATPVIDAFLDNDIAYLAAEEYRQFIQKPPGSGPIRGVAILNNQLYCWRNNAGNTAQIIYRATSSGWTEVNLGFRVNFTAGTSAYQDGGTVTQGSVNAVIRRVVVTSGTWSGSNATGYLIINAPVGGNFASGVAGGTGNCTLSGPQTPVQIGAGGKVQTVVYNFSGEAGKERLYGCDGVNKEFEFDGTVYVPIETGMGTRRAKAVAAHKNHLFFSFDGSLQNSAIGDPYRWQPLFGAGEIGTGDVITNLMSVPGSESSAALMVLCRDSVHVLYGDSTLNWQLRKLSDQAGAQAYSAQVVGPVLAFDRDGVAAYSPTDVFGNFSYESASREIEPLVKNSTVACSVLVKNRSRVRILFIDGTFISGLPAGRRWSWMAGNYGKPINVAVGGEIAGQYRVFMGAEDGWVYEADVGRSFDGETIDAGLRLSSDNQRSVTQTKTYRFMEVQTEAGSAFELAAGTEFSDSIAADAQANFSAPVDFQKQYGSGLFYDFNSWDRAYWDQAAVSRAKYPLRGIGRSLSILFSSSSDRETPHTLKTVTVLFTRRRLTR